MYLKSIALFVAIYGRGALAALPLSCQEGDAGACATGGKCTPLNTEFEPPQTGEVWFSQCCTESETSTATPPVTTTKQYCFSYSLQGWSNNLHHNIKPACSKSGGGNLAWDFHGQCSTNTGTVPYTILPPVVPDGCPGEYDPNATYELGDMVEDNGVVYVCTGSALFCSDEAPDLKGNGLNYWKPTFSCTGTASPTGSPTFGTTQAGCPEEIDLSSNTYLPGESVSVPLKDGRSLVYTCRPFPEGRWCDNPMYSPLSTDKQCNGELCWPDAWNKIGGCDGTYTPTSTPTFDPANIEGCPEEYEAGTEYEGGDKVSVTPAGEDYGKIYQCKSWPNSGHCSQEAYSPANTDKGCNGEVCWPDAWAYIGGCTGTITPTSTPTFNKIPQWDLGGCPDPYVEDYPYKPEDVVSVSKNEDNTYGVVWQCKNALSAPWCQLKSYAPGTHHASEAWEILGHCSGTIAPTTQPTQFTGVCQFKYKLEETADRGEYVVLQADSWVNGGTSVSTSGTALDLYKPGHLVRYGNDARKCAPYPNSGFCEQFSPFLQDVTYNPTNSPKGWKEATCEAVGNNGVADTFNPSNNGPVFDSNGIFLVTALGSCVNGAINPQDYFKAGSPEGCSKCPSDEGFGSPAAPKVCTTCEVGTSDKIVNGKSQCVCDNGATDPWDANGLQCQACSDGKKYIGGVNNSDGIGVCQTACPTSFPYYTTNTVGTVPSKLCCTESGCTGAGVVADCWDGTTGKTFCTAALT